MVKKTAPKKQSEKQKTKTVDTPFYDVCIVGGGLMGLTFAALLGDYGIRVALLEKFPIPKTLDDSFDGRTTALSLGSKRVLEAAGIWDKIKKECCPIDEIRVADGDSPHYLHFDHKEVGTNPFGWIVDNRFMRLALYQILEKAKNIDYLAPSEAKEFSYEGNHVIITLDDGVKLKTSLLIGADGKHSSVRLWAGLDAKGWDYDQTALVFAVMHELDHENIAVEHFLPAGPFAILPMLDDEKGNHRSSVVWSIHSGEGEGNASNYLEISEKDFNTELQNRFGDQLGWVKLIGKRFSYPLSLQHAKKYTAKRVALIGEAAHKIHPIAGQGLNLGMRDVALLVELIVEAKRLGLDIGSELLLKKYEKKRRIDNTAMAVATDGLTRLFSNDIKPVAWARAFGLGIVQKTPPLKRFFMKQAMGLSVGVEGRSATQALGTPKLLKGEKI